MADAAYDADHLRDFIARDLQAAAHIKRNPTRNTDRPISWALYKERQTVECFFQSDQTVPPDCAALRENRFIFPCLRFPGLRNGMASLNEDTA